MKSSIILCVAASLAFSTVLFANPGQGKGLGPCQQIVKACTDAGFVKGKYKQGYGLWDDCVDPVVQGITTVPGATKPLPSVDPNLVAACKAKKPKFGSGKVGSR